MQDAKIDNHGLVVRRLNSRIETSDFSCQAQRQNDKIKLQRNGNFVKFALSSFNRNASKLHHNIYNSQTYIVSASQEYKYAVNYTDQELHCLVILTMSWIPRSLVLLGFELA
jgi:hypothetical protein